MAKKPRKETKNRELLNECKKLQNRHRMRVERQGTNKIAYPLDTPQGQKDWLMGVIHDEETPISARIKAQSQLCQLCGFGGMDMGDLSTKSTAELVQIGEEIVKPIMESFFLSNKERGQASQVQG